MAHGVITARFRIVASIILLFLGLSSAYSAELSKTAVEKSKSYNGEVLLIRGWSDVFSRGMDQIAEKLLKKGIEANVISNTASKSAAERIISDQKKYGRKPIVLIGHSLGANEVLRIAQILNAQKVKVDFIVTFAATNPPLVPPNVRKLTNYYFAENGWGEPVSRAKGARGRIKNINMDAKPGVHHFNLEKQPRLQRQVIRNIMRFVSPKGRG